MRVAEAAMASTAEVAGEQGEERAPVGESTALTTRRPDRLAGVAMSSRLAATASTIELRREREMLLHYVR